MSQEVLELSALAPVRPQARIKTDADPDGTLYELAVPEDFGAVSLRELGNKYQEVEDLMGRTGKLTKAQDKRVELLLGQLTRSLILEVPEDVAAALPFVTKRSLVMRFFIGLGEEMQTVMGPQGERLMQLISENSSPASRGSTAETPTSG